MGYTLVLLLCVQLRMQWLIIINTPPPPQCHQVSTFTCLRAVVFSTFSMHHTQRQEKHNCRAPGRRMRDVTRTHAGVRDETLLMKSVAGVQGTSRMTSQEHASEFTDIMRHHPTTSWIHRYKGITENGRAGSHLVPMILPWP
jgi:hypothetical protein